MAVEEHPLFKDWSAASEKLDIAKMRYDAAMKAGHPLILRAAESKLREAKKTYNDIVARLMPKGPKGERRPADVIGNAVKVMRIATGEDSDTVSVDGKNKL